ncbi:MAG: hypothetical protein COB30_008860 [Ectothiorhodospiraceae bacterium]|nr:hypothetical protein [Ectothiorhodospiraceae bacterium]
MTRTIKKSRTECLANSDTAQSLLWVLLWAPLLSALLIGCSPRVKFDAERQPEWVTGASEKYTTARYFVGKGNANSLALAAEDARAALAKTLPGLPAPDPSLTEPSQKTSTAYASLVQSAKVVDAWHDKTAQQHFALVVIERGSTVAVLQQQLTELDDKTKQLITAATQGSDYFLKIRSTHAALNTQQQRADLLLALRTLGNDTKADDAIWSKIELQVHLKSLLSSIDVKPRNGKDRQLNSAVVRGLDAAGYLSTGMTASLELKTTLERSGMKWQQGWFREQGTLFVELLDQNNQVRGKAQWPLDIKTQERAMLNKEFMGEVTNILREQLGDTVLGVLEE